MDSSKPIPIAPTAAAPIASIQNESQIPPSADQNISQSSFHLMPCHIHYTGPAQLSTFFKSEIINEDLTKIAAFQGYPLLGNKIQLPNEYQFYAISEEEKLKENETNEG